MFQHLILSGHGEVLNRGKDISELVIIRNSLFNAGLLHNDLRKPDQIGIGRPPKRKVTGICLVPFKKLVQEIIHRVAKVR